MIYLVAVFSFVFTVLFLGQMVLFFSRKERTINYRLRQTGAESVPVTRKEISRAIVTRKLRRKLSSIQVFGFTQPVVDKLQKNITKAGVPMKAGELVLIMVFLIIGSVVLGITLSGSFVAGLLSGMIAFLLPIIWLSHLRKQRNLKFEGQLMETLTMVANSLRAGQSLLQALEMASREINPPLGQELARLVQETRLGMSLEDALNNLNQRIDNKDVDLLVAGIQIQWQTGGNLAEIINGVAHTIDNRIRNRAKIKVLTAQGRMSAWIIGLMPIALGIVVFLKNESFRTIMFENLLGQIMLGGSFVMLVIGIFVIREVIKIDV